MRLLNFKKLVNPLRVTALVSACAFTMSCTKGGSISSSGSSSSIEGTLTLDLVYPDSSGATWTPITLSNRIYIKGLAVTVTGTCTRGVDKIHVNEGGADYSEMGTCTSNGTFTWNKTYTSVTGEGDKTLTFKAYDSAGLVISNATATKDVRIDNTPPAVTTISNPAGYPYPTPYPYSGATSAFTIEGDAAVPETDHLTGPNGDVISVNASTGHWTHDITVVLGSSTDYTYYTWDLAGNQSAGVTQKITWSPSLLVSMASVVSGGPLTDTSGANYTMETSHDANPDKAPDDPTTLYKLTTGFNSIINTMRGL